MLRYFAKNDENRRSWKPDARARSITKDLSMGERSGDVMVTICRATHVGP